MPTWLKIVLALLVIGVVLVVVAGFLVAGLFKSGVAASQEAAAKGKGFGFNNTLDACVEAGVRLAGSCEEKQLGCVMNTDAFLWGCVEAANFDQEFCAEVPLSGHDAATRKWSRSACAAHGHAGSETCAFALQVIPAFCTYRKQTG